MKTDYVEAKSLPIWNKYRDFFKETREIIVAMRDHTQEVVEGLKKIKEIELAKREPPECPTILSTEKTLSKIPISSKNGLESNCEG